jgi:methanogenic corrinoid protein MtbC1
MIPDAPAPSSTPAGGKVGRAPGQCTVPGDLQALTRACLADDLVEARALCSRLGAQGVSVRSLLIDLVTPVARHLGELWSDDACDFVQVTVATALLRELVLDIAPEPEANAPADAEALRIMLAPVPGSQHTLGLLVLSRCFALAGWAVWSNPCATLAELREQTSRVWFDAVGFSIGSQLHATGLAEAITAVRASSVNPDVQLIVGGPALLDDDELGQRVGADGAALDADSALRLARALVAKARSEALAA